MTWRQPSLFFFPTATSGSSSTGPMAKAGSANSITEHSRSSTRQFNHEKTTIETWPGAAARAR
jgi:hypothetical protein